MIGWEGKAPGRPAPPTAREGRVRGGGTRGSGGWHHAAEIQESKEPITKRTKSHLPVVGSRIRHQISTSHMCFRADGHISVSERPQTRDFHRNRHPKMPIFGACGAQNRHPTGARRRCRPQPTPKFPVKNPMTFLPYTKFRDLTEELADTPEGGVPAPGFEADPPHTSGSDRGCIRRPAIGP